MGRITLWWRGIDAAATTVSNNRHTHCNQISHLITQRSDRLSSFFSIFLSSHSCLPCARQHAAIQHQNIQTNEPYYLPLQSNSPHAQNAYIFYYLNQGASSSETKKKPRQMSGTEYMGNLTILREFLCIWMPNECLHKLNVCFDYSSTSIAVREH